MGSSTSAPFIRTYTNGGSIIMSAYAGSVIINSDHTSINGGGALLTLGNTNETVNVQGGMIVNAIGETTVASTVKF